METTVTYIIELIGTMAFAISGIRLAAIKHFDLFGAYVVGMITAIGGGTIRDMMLGVTPVWLENITYLTITALSLLMFILAGDYIMRFKNTFFIFDTIGLSLFTITGLTKTIDAGLPCWAGIIMGVITGCFGGVLRDIIVGELPLLFRRDIYALASLLGGAIFVILLLIGVAELPCFIISSLSIIAIRTIAVRFSLHLPTLDYKERG